MTSVSVVVCAYNSADTLGAALDSALTQSLPSQDYEVLLVDDGSTDRTRELAAGYQQEWSNLQSLRFPANRGLAAACNHGLEFAQGRYFIRLDADDTFHRDILTSCVTSLEQGEADMVYCDRYEVAQPEGTRRLVRVEPFNLFELIACGTMLRTDVLREIGGYHSLFWEEYDLFLRYLQHSQRPPVRIPRPLYYYSRHADGMTADRPRVRQGWEELKQIWGEDVLRKFGWNGLEPQA